MELLDASMLLPAPPTFNIFQHSHKGQTLNRWIFCTDLQAVILQLSMAFHGILPFQWRPFKCERQLLSLCWPFTFKACRPAPMFPPLFEGRFKNGMQQFFVFFPPWNLAGTTRKKEKKLEQVFTVNKTLGLRKPLSTKPHNLRLHPTLMELPSSRAFHLCTSTNKCNNKL